MIPNNCHTCKWRRNVPGSAHSRCGHPEVEKVSSGKDGSLLYLFASFASVERMPPMMLESKLNIRGDPYGISNGWFNWPWNFDPTWLENCDGYEKQVEKQ